MIKLDYIPSWIDGATTLLSKLNKCIEKIESLSTTSNNALEVANNALSLAQTNEQDIGVNDGEIAVLQGQVTELNQNMNRTLKTPLQTPSEEEVVTILPNNSQGSKPISQLGGKVYRHDISIELSQGRQAYVYLSIYSNSQNPFSLNDIFNRIGQTPFIGFFSDTSNFQTREIIIYNNISNYDVEVLSLEGVSQEYFPNSVVESVIDNVIEA